VLEDNPLFNAGRGAVFTAEGRNELDAAIMDGKTQKAGAVAGVTRTRHPIDLARAVMEKSPHVMLSGAGADRFSVEQHLEQVDPSWFRTEERWQGLLRWREKQVAAVDPTHLFGTVGAVAIDAQGDLAAATSTGGMTGKRWGRIGDSPVIGAGTYAKNGQCAVSATGSGEYFIRESAARQVCDRVAWNGESLAGAAQATIMAVGAIGGDGGLIAMGPDGRPYFAINDLGMYRGSVTAGRQAAIVVVTRRCAADDRATGQGTGDFARADLHAARKAGGGTGRCGLYGSPRPCLYRKPDARACDDQDAAAFPPRGRTGPCPSAAGAIDPRDQRRI
jgi:beta-aspartyl-peptidase (threonine type)